MELELLTGEEVSMTGSRFVGKYLSAVFDEDQKFVILKPKIPKDIFRL